MELLCHGENQKHKVPVFILGNNLFYSFLKGIGHSIRLQPFCWHERALYSQIFILFCMHGTFDHISLYSKAELLNSCLSREMSKLHFQMDCWKGFPISLSLLIEQKQQFWTTFFMCLISENRKYEKENRTLFWKNVSVYSWHTWNLKFGFTKLYAGTQSPTYTIL